MSALERDVLQSYLLNDLTLKKPLPARAMRVRLSIRSTCWFCESKVKVNIDRSVFRFVTIQTVLLDVVVDPIALF
jgi:hypothetical protein